MAEDRGVKWFAPAWRPLPAWITAPTEERPPVAGPADRAPLLTSGQARRSTTPRTPR